MLFHPIVTVTHFYNLLILQTYQHSYSYSYSYSVDDVFRVHYHSYNYLDSNLSSFSHQLLDQIALILLLTFVPIHFVDFVVLFASPIQSTLDLINANRYIQITRVHYSDLWLYYDRGILYSTTNDLNII